MDYPIEYHDRMMAEQMVIMEALQFIWQILICFTILMTVVSLIVNISGLRQIAWRKAMKKNIGE